MERTDTRPKFKLTPQGKYKFTVKSVPIKKMSMGGKPYYEFVFEYLDGTNSIQEHKEIVMLWMAAPLLKAMEFNELEPGVFEWDKEEAVGKTIEAEIVHEADKKDPTRTRAKMVNHTPSLPF